MEIDNFNLKYDNKMLTLPEALWSQVVLIEKLEACVCVCVLYCH